MPPYSLSQENWGPASAALPLCLYTIGWYFLDLLSWLCSGNAVIMLDNYNRYRASGTEAGTYWTAGRCWFPLSLSVKSMDFGLKQPWVLIPTLLFCGVSPCGSSNFCEPNFLTCFDLCLLEQLWTLEKIMYMKCLVKWICSCNLFTM